MNNNMDWNNDYVFYKGEDGKMYGGGFCVEDILNKIGGANKLFTLNESQSGGSNNNNNNNNIEQFSDIFKSYVVPSGLFSFPYKNLNSLLVSGNTSTPFTIFTNIAKSTKSL